MAQNQVWLGQTPGESNKRSKKKSDEELMGTENAGRQQQKEGGGGERERENISSVMSLLGHYR